MSVEQDQKGQQAAATVSPADFELLSREVGKIKERLDEDKKGFVGWIRRWGVVLAFVLSVSSLPRAFLDVRHFIKTSWFGVSVSKIKDAPFEVIFSSDEGGKVNNIEYHFSVKVKNQDNEPYYIDDLGAMIRTPKQPLINLQPRDAQVNCYESKDGETKGDPLIKSSITIPSGASVTMRCEAVLRPHSGGAEVMQLNVCQQLTFQIKSGDKSIEEKFFAASTGEAIVKPTDSTCDD